MTSTNTAQHQQGNPNGRGTPALLVDPHPQQHCLPPAAAIEGDLSHSRRLEERVQELETKLAVLSRLLKLQHVTSANEAVPAVFHHQNGSASTATAMYSGASTPSESSPPPPPPPSESPPQTPRRDRSYSIPVLESPASFLGCGENTARSSWRKMAEESAATRTRLSPIMQRSSIAKSTNTTESAGEVPPIPGSSFLPVQSLFEGPPLAGSANGTIAQSSSESSGTLKVASRHSNSSHSHNTTASTPLVSNTGDSSNTSPPPPPTLQLPQSALKTTTSTKTPRADPQTDTHTTEAISASKRNLSFRLLYEGDEKAYAAGKRRDSTPPAPSSMNLAERRWLGSIVAQSIGERPDDNIRSRWLNFLNSVQESTPDVDVQMEQFIKVPSKVESIMTFGFFICIDSFLYCLTVLPIRFVWSCLLLLNRVLRPLLRQRQPAPAFTFHRQHSYQMIQVFILYFVHVMVLGPISIGQLYHWIRGQAMIKLYVLIAIVEVFDRLMCSMGQDCLDSMYWNTVNRPTSTRMIISVVVVLVYCTIHTLLLFVHVATLNVAMNSADQALLALLISGNFAEIKSTVFKKYNRPALFKLTASDICERFKLGLFLGLVLLLNYCQGMERHQFLQFLRTCGLIWGGELLADWIKHSFITKFNFLPARVFVEYSLLLAGDVTGIGHEGVNIDNSHAVVKRLGFAQLPFVCVSFRLVRETAKYAALPAHYGAFTAMGMLVTLWIIALVGKLVLGSALHQISLSKLRAAPEMKYTPKKKKS